MYEESRPNLLARALAAYRGVVADPRVFGPEAARLVAEARAGGDTAALVAALRAEAWFERSRLAHGRARALLDEAVRTARRQRLDSLLGQVLVTRGAVNHELGRLAAARRDFEQAAGLIDPEMATELASQQATLHHNMGRLSDAAVLYRRILADPDTPPEVRYKVANNLGMIEAECGHPEAALACFAEATAAAEEVGPAAVARVALARAWAVVQVVVSPRASTCSRRRATCSRWRGCRWASSTPSTPTRSPTSGSSRRLLSRRSVRWRCSRDRGWR